jgi:uncharacterized protein (DUF488 family)
MDVSPLAILRKFRRPRSLVNVTCSGNLGLFSLFFRFIFSGMKPKIIYTIGYEDATVDALMRRLEASNIEVLIDVRAVPLSRKPGFSKNFLAERLAASGIEYLGLKVLGTPAAGRNAARRGRIQEMRAIFSAHMNTRIAQEDLERAIETAKRQPSCLLCFEHAPGMCHRKIVADIMAEKTGLKVDHLDPVNT